jgi:quercetin dioxygenase-like cupin family protein
MDRGLEEEGLRHAAHGSGTPEDGAWADRVDVRRRADAVPIDEGGERAFLYFESDRLAFATAVVPAGATSSRDPGHPGAHEVVLCVAGTIDLDLDDGAAQVRLAAGDAALIHDGVPHVVRNPGPETAHLVWSAAPSLGRPSPSS